MVAVARRYDKDEYHDAEEDGYDEGYSDAEFQHDNEDYCEGRIVYYDSSRGFGFIRDADDERIYYLPRFAIW